MNKPFPERRPFFLLVILLSVLLVLLSHQVKRADGQSLLGDSLLAVTGPALRTVSGGFGFLVDTWNSYADLRGTREENQALRARVEELEAREKLGTEQEMENRRLRSLLRLREKVELPSLAAEVLTFGLSGQTKSAIIDRGSRDGIKRNMPVVNRRGLVGRVHRVGSSVAQVQLFIDPNSGVAAVIQRTRVQGIVLGMGDDGGRMAYVADKDEVEAGDVVMTSGIDQIYPPGLIIGVVSNVEEGDDLTKNVFVRPEVDFGKLDEVLVLVTTDSRQEEVESLK